VNDVHNLAFLIVPLAAVALGWGFAYWGGPHPIDSIGAFFSLNATAFTYQRPAGHAQPPSLPATAVI
jgi:hypothetical protein